MGDSGNHTTLIDRIINNIDLYTIVKRASLVLITTAKGFYIIGLYGFIQIEDLIKLIQESFRRKHLD